MSASTADGADQRPELGTLKLLLVEYQNGDPEAFSYACEIVDVFKEAGIEVRGGANSYIGIPVFGLHISGSAEINMVSMVKALEDAGIPFGGVRDVSAMAVLRGDPRPNLYIFVAPKMPLTLSTDFVQGRV